MKKFDVIFLGASLAAGAAACRLAHSGRKILLIEKGVLTAPEFTVFYQGSPEHTEPQERETREFCRKLRERNILTEQALVYPAIHPALCAELEKEGVSCLFRARPQKITRMRDGFFLSILSLGIHLEVKAPIFCDATLRQQGVHLLRGEALPSPKERFLSYVTAAGEKGPLRYRTLPVSGSEMTQEAASLLYHRQNELGLAEGERICCVSAGLGERPEPTQMEKTDGYWVLPFAPGLQQAYDAGIRLAKKIEEELHGALQIS